MGAPQGAKDVRWLDQDQLIAANPLAPVGDGAGARGIDRDRLIARIDHHEVVAEPVHLVKAKRHVRDLGSAEASVYFG